MSATTASPARMLPWQQNPSPVTPPAQSKHSEPVNEAERPAMSTIPTWRVSRSESPSRRRPSASCGERPCPSRSRPRTPNVTSAKAWVATAPTPPRAQGTTAPAARNLDCTATPASPASGSTAAIENVDGRMDRTRRTRTSS